MEGCVKIRRMRGFAVAALALAGFLFAWTPVAERADLALLDARIVLLHKLGPRPAPDDILIVGVDDTDLTEIPVPAGLWHEPIARVLLKVASAKPRAIGLDLPLPERSVETFRPGLDRAFLVALATAAHHSVLVAGLNIDARTRSVRPIHGPLLAVLDQERLGVGLFGRDADGVIRQFSLAVPTEDGTFPTFAGRLCLKVARTCRDGHIDFALGIPFRYVPFREILRTNDTSYLEKLFKGRVILIGEAQRFANRFEVPVNLAGWEAGGKSSPGIVIHAAALRSAMHGLPATSPGKPLLLLLVSAAALLALMRHGGLAIVSAIVLAAVLFAGATAALRAGLVVDLAAPLATLLAAAAGSLLLGRVRGSS